MTPQQAKEHTRAARLSWRIDNLVDFIDERIRGVDDSACLQELEMLLEEIDELEPLASFQWRGVEGIRSMGYSSIAFEILRE